MTCRVEAYAFNYLFIEITAGKCIPMPDMENISILADIYQNISWYQEEFSKI